MNKFKCKRIAKLQAGLCGFSGCRQPKEGSRTLCKKHLRKERIRHRWRYKKSKETKVPEVITELSKPLTEIEAAELLAAVEHNLSKKAVMLLRRLLFQRDQMKDAVIKLVVQTLEEEAKSLKGKTFYHPEISVPVFVRAAVESLYTNKPEPPHEQRHAADPTPK